MAWLWTVPMIASFWLAFSAAFGPTSFFLPVFFTSDESVNVYTCVVILVTHRCVQGRLAMPTAPLERVVYSAAWEWCLDLIRCTFDTQWFVRSDDITITSLRCGNRLVHFFFSSVIWIVISSVSYSCCLWSVWMSIADDRSSDMHRCWCFQ